MYIRVNSMSIIRVGRKFSRLSTLLVIMLVSLTFLFLVTLISPEDAKVVPENDANYRLAELSTWKINQSLLIEDYIDLRDPHSFILQPTGTNGMDDISPYCGTDNVKLLIMVASAPKNIVARNVIRETWGSKQVLWEKGCRLLFMLGRSDNATVDELIAEESTKYDDIVMEDFRDTYHNLTLKSVAMLKWVNLTCTKNNVTEFPQRLLKTDDDIFINIDRLLRVIQEMPNARMIGRLTCGATPIGDSTSKLYMPKYLYLGKVYPGYLSGTAYVLKSNIIPTLLENTAIVPILHLEDIYITGLLARRSGIYPDDSAFFTYNRIEPKDDCALRFMVNSHQMTPPEMKKIYANLKTTPSLPCNLKKAKWLRRVPKNISKRLRNLCLFSR
ncbi:beta-1,3-galactosyltransferase 1 isoform X2 [Folsomia candida]|uniref:beta-1,3-galactosyltransferase 1 isoform X2 n=1 Tax=Folsomia candida TaxID=158441 RepID=UPI000B8FC1E1|nr:beta-1,3-galactosyltransferase 1 isoform X2 [Folsomia candida]